MRFQRAPVRHVHMHGKQISEVMRDPDIPEQINARLRRKLHQNIDITCPSGFSARH